MSRTLPVAALLCVLGAVGVSAQPAAANHSNASYDAFNHSRVNTTPYTSGRDVTLSAGPINTATFSFTGSEPAGCGAHGGKTAWVRFDSAVAGRLDVSAITNFNVILYAHELKPTGNRTNPDPNFSADIQDLLVTPPGQPPFRGSCNAGNPGNNEVLTFLRVTPNLPVWVQVIGFCAAQQADPCADRSTTPPTLSGTISSLNLVFSPDDSDNDDIADTLDSCRGRFGSQPNGCPPDFDRDGRYDDRDDDCIGQPNDNGRGCFVHSDSDGVPDRTDECDRRPGERRNGCPIALDVRFDICWQAFRGRTVIVKRRPRRKRCGLSRGNSGLKIRYSKKLKGTRIRFRCRPVKRCGVKDLDPRPLNDQTVSFLRSQLIGENFRRGAELEFFVTRRNSWGVYRQFFVRPRKVPRLRSRCLDSLKPGGRTRALSECE